MRVLLLAVLLSGCGSACSTSTENVPEPSGPAEAKATAEQARAEAPSDTPATPAPAAPAPSREPVDPADERVVYASPGARAKVRFAASDDAILLVDLQDAVEDAEQLSFRDAFGNVRWKHDYGHVEGLALDAEGAYAVADGHLYAYALDSGEPTDLGEATGELALTASHVYVHSLKTVKRFARSGGPGKKVASHPEPGFHRMRVSGDKLVILASAYRNRPARFPKLGMLLVGPAGGGKLKERFSAMYSPGPSMELDSGFAYFGASRAAEEDFEYRIMRVPLKGPAKAEVVVNHPIANFAVEGEHIFAAARLGEAQGVWAFAVADAEPVLLSEFSGGATQVSLSDSYVYWESRGRVYRISKDVPKPAVQGAELEPEAAKAKQGT